MVQDFFYPFKISAGKAISFEGVYQTWMRPATDFFWIFNKIIPTNLSRWTESFKSSLISVVETCLIRLEEVHDVFVSVEGLVLPKQQNLFPDVFFHDLATNRSWISGFYFLGTLLDLFLMIASKLELFQSPGFLAISQKACKTLNRFSIPYLCSLRTRVFRLLAAFDLLICSLLNSRRSASSMKTNFHEV